jgi:hypothetical protein
MQDEDERMARAVELALRRVLSDKEVVEAFWERGFEELAEHANRKSSEWIGRRILTAMVVAITTAGIVWLVKTGAIK